MKGKFLIKGKRLNKLDAAFSNNNTTTEDGTVSEEDEAAESKEGKENDQKSKPSKSSKSKIKLAKELSDLVLYCKSVHFSGFEHAKDSQAFYEMSSFKESKAFSLAEASGEETENLQPLLHVNIQGVITHHGDVLTHVGNAPADVLQ